MNLLRLLRTVRYLKAEQVAHQIAHRARRLIEHPERFAKNPAHVFEGCQWPAEMSFIPSYSAQAPIALASGQFTFLNESADLSRPVDWAPPARRKLWLYNLHYFNYLWELDYTQARDLVREWVGGHPLKSDQVGWEAYPTSLRLINWCTFFWGKWREKIDCDVQFRGELWQSLAVQATWLGRHLERHLLGNHLLENAAALLVFGYCFNGALADDSARRGGLVFEAQLLEQILGDGGHFERSPMYQGRVAHVLATVLIAGAGRVCTDEIESALRRIERSLMQLCHPDGDIALFNDSAFGTYHPPAELGRSIRALLGEPAGPQLGAFALRDTGYFGARSANGSYVICDAGPVGPDYLPGHAHGDIFSFELSLNGRRVVVDSGVHDYERSGLRAYCRSTKAHNTIEVDGQDQCEFWAAFRVGRRGRPRDVKWDLTSDGFDLEGWHDGYRHLRGSPKHHRRFQWRESGILQVWDRVDSTASHELNSRVHLAPECEIVRIEGKVVQVRAPSGDFYISFSGDGNLTVEESLYCPEFGRAVPNRVLVMKACVNSLWEGGFCISPGDAHASE